MNQLTDEPGSNGPMPNPQHGPVLSFSNGYEVEWKKECVVTSSRSPLLQCCLLRQIVYIDLGPIFILLNENENVIHCVLSEYVCLRVPFKQPNPVD